MKKIVLFAFILLVSACIHENKVDPKSALKEIASFSFKKANNPALNNDVDAVITGKDIKISLPANTLTNALIATFNSSPLSTVSVNGVKQSSSTTANNFGNPIMYRVTAEDGSSNDYTVSVTIQTPIPSSSKDLLSFSLGFKSFSGKDIESTGKIAANKVTLFLPPGVDVQRIKPTFSLSDKATVLVNGQNQTSGQSIANMSKPVIYQVIAEDKSTKEYEITGISIDQTIDNLVKNFIAKYNITGLSFSMTKNDQLVYSKGYGIANKSTNEAVSVNSLFRIASVSKPITAVAIMKLVEEGKLSLDSKVFGPNSIFGTKYGAVPYLPGYEDITVRHILEHRSGLPTNDGNDPMFTSPFDLTQDQIIDNTVRTDTLLTTPGHKYYYSNFGFLVLGRVIEKISGVPYINYLQNNILTPSDISTIQITGNTIDTRKKDEVVYYNSNYSPYAFNVARMDSHGGLIASSIDLVKFLAHVDGFPYKPNILKAETINTMTKYNANSEYSLGWAVNSSNNWWHTGSLTGTSSEIVRANNGFSWAIVSNYGCVDCTDNYFTDLDDLGWKIQTAVNQWPDYDLF